jgi:hypothetical protein
MQNASPSTRIAQRKKASVIAAAPEKLVKLKNSFVF